MTIPLELLQNYGGPGSGTAVGGRKVTSTSLLPKFYTGLLEPQSNHF